jgi:hypothetical protein
VKKALLCVVLVLAFGMYSVAQEGAKSSLSIVADTIGPPSTTNGKSGVPLSGNVVVVIDGTTITANAGVLRASLNEIELGDGAVRVTFSTNSRTTTIRARNK